MSQISSPSPAIHTGKRSRLPSFARLDGVGRVWVLNLCLLASTLGVYLLLIDGHEPLPAPFHIPWYVLAVLFYLAEIFVVHIEFQGDAHSMSLGEIPLVLGLFFTGPEGLVLAQLVGDTAALAIHRRQSPVKLAFNVGHFTLETAVAAAIFGAVVALGDPIGPAGWAATYAAVIASSVIGVVMIFAAISLSEGRAQLGLLTQMFGTGSVVSVANASIALAVVTVAWIDPSAAWVLLVPAAVLFFGYRAYTSMAHRRDGLEFLNQAIRTFHRSPQPGEGAILELLSQTRRMFRAEVVELIFLPSTEDEDATRTSIGPADEVVVMEPIDLRGIGSAIAGAVRESSSTLVPRRGRGMLPSAQVGDRELRDAMVAPITGQEGVIGAILTGNRLGDLNTFGDRDLRLLETLAQHLGLSLENARLDILEETVAQLSEINQMKDDLIASTSHELRTPLTSIQGFVKTLLSPDIQLSLDEQRSFLETVARQSERLNRLVEDLLTASRLESEHEALVAAPVMPAALATRVADEVTPQAGTRVVRVEVDPATRSVLTDGERVHRILSNLVVNAIKYSPDGSTITILADSRDEGVVLAVRDEGDGIPSEVQRRIFDRFYQVDQSSTRSAGGVGLGLYICSKLADTLGGRLWLERSDAKGSLFCLLVPWAPPDEANDAPEARADAG